MNQSTVPIFDGKTARRQSTYSPTPRPVSKALRHQKKPTRYLRIAEHESGGKRQAALRWIPDAEGLIRSALRRLTDAVSDSRNQRDRILHLLKAAAPGWVPAPALARISLQYSARIFELRPSGWKIANRVEIVDGRNTVPFG